MLRYYMTPETRDAVIAESNRLIATRAKSKASLARRDSPPTDFGASSQWGLWGSLPYLTRGSETLPKWQGLLA